MLTVSEQYDDYANQIVARLRGQMVRAELAPSMTHCQRKLAGRDAQDLNLLIIGEREVADGTVTAALRSSFVYDDDDLRQRCRRQSVSAPEVVTEWGQPAGGACCPKRVGALAVIGAAEGGWRNRSIRSLTMRPASRRSGSSSISFRPFSSATVPSCAAAFSSATASLSSRLVGSFD